MEEFGSPNDGVDGLWPKSIDVHVHLHHMLISTKPLLDGRIRNMFLDEDGIAGPPGVWYCVQAVLGSSASPLGIANSKTEEASPSNRLTPLSTHLHIVPTMT